MTDRVRFLTVALAVALIRAAAAQGRGDVDVERTLTAWVATWNSYDLDQVDRLFVTDASVTYFSSEKPGLIRGIDAVREHHRSFGFVPGGKRTGARLWLEDVVTDLHGDVALVRATWFFQRAAGPDAPTQRGPMTAVYVRRTGQWRIAHMHFANDPPKAGGEGKVG